MAKKHCKILIIDDNEEFLVGMKLFLTPHFQEIVTIRNPEKIPHYVSKNHFDVILLDMNFSAGVNSGNEGLYWMKKILSIAPSAVIVLVTAYGEIELAVKAVKQGAFDFIQKTQNEEQILSTVLSAYQHSQNQQKSKNENQASYLSPPQTPQMFVGKSKTMNKIMKLVDKVAATDANVLILGENGTGKEVLAKEIHCRSTRNQDVFVHVDMAAITETLFESELFGFVRGAFTDARDDKPGRFEIASGGTLFLDEIGNLPINLQTKILTVLQNRQITRIGSTSSVPIDVRLISATNKNLKEMIVENTFREDLLYRINTIEIELPPLRKRMDDIPGLAEFFLQKFRKKYDRPNLEVDASGLEKLMSHHWPGNIREFLHKLEKAIILSDNDTLSAQDFHFTFNVGLQRKASDDRYNIEEHEKTLIRKALSDFEGNMSKTAKQLGITRSTLYKKINKYGI